MDRRREILAALRDAGGVAVSGEVLAAGLGVSRAAVGKHVATLRDLGYGIEAVAGEGYRLTSHPEAPIPEEVGSLVTDPLWVRLEGGGPTASTSDDAKALARAGAPEGTVVLADEQTGGRGRMGRVWDSPVGGAYLSVVLRPQVSMAEAPPLALVVALGIAQGLEDLGARLGADMAPLVKWPNDVLLEGAKLAGVLLETAAEADGVDWVVVGCGVNVRRPADADGSAGDVRAVAAYLEHALPRVTPAAVAAAVLDGIAGAYRAFGAGRFAALREAFEARHALADRAVTVSDREGRVLASGTVSGVDEWGRLEVETAEGPVALSAGEVTLA